MDNLTSQQIKDIYMANGGNAWVIRLLDQAPPFPYDAANIKEVSWTTYEQQTLTPTLIDEIPDYGEIRLSAKPVFKFNGPEDTSTAWGLFITDSLSVPPFVIGVVPLDAEDANLVNIGAREYEFEVVARFAELRVP